MKQGKIHFFSHIKAEQSHTGKWWRYEVSLCGRKASIGDWPKVFTQTKQPTCKVCCSKLDKRKP